MQVKQLKNKGLEYSFEVTLDAKEIDTHLDNKLSEYAKTMKLPGFRPGKVPAAVVKQRYGKAVMGEVLELAVNDSSMKAIREKGLKPALQPKIEVKEFDEGKDLTYTMDFEVIPDFDVMDFKSVKLERLKAEPDEKAVEESLERIASSNQQSEPITGKRGAKNGDILVIDFHGRTKKDDKAHEGMSAHGHNLELGSGQFIPGFEEQLVGKKAGEKVEVEVTFPEEYHAAELAGEVAIFDVEIHEIREKVAGKIDDDFAKTLGMDSVDALKDAVKGQMQNEYDQLGQMKLKRQLLDLLDENHDMPVPAGMLDLEFQNIKQQISMERQGELNEDGQLELSKDEEEELTAIAERRVKLGMVLSEVGNSNNIVVSDQELQRAVIQEAQKYPGQEAQVFEYYKSNQQALEALRAPAFEDKVVEYIIELAEVTDKEVSVDELTKEDDEAYEKPKAKAKKSTATKKKTTAAKKEDGDKKPAAKKKAPSQKENNNNEEEVKQAYLICVIAGLLCVQSTGGSHGRAV